MKAIHASELFDYTAENYDAIRLGPVSDFTVQRPATLDQIATKCLSFCTRDSVPYAATQVPDAVLLCTPDAATHIQEEPTTTLISVDNPRLVFGRLLQVFFAPPPTYGIHPSAIIDDNAVIGKDVRIEPGAVIGPDCRIGDGSVIGANVVLERNVRVGRNCTVRAGSTLGHPGFGVETDTNGIQFQLPHLGGVILEDDVTIGSQCTVVAGTISPTTIGHNVMTDDHVHIAHNVVIGARTLITACAEISGSVTIGADAWLGPNCSLMNKITIGNRSMVGLGAVVTKSCPENVILAGNPARILKKRYPE